MAAPNTDTCTSMPRAFLSLNNGRLSCHEGSFLLRSRTYASMPAATAALVPSKVRTTRAIVNALYDLRLVNDMTCSVQLWRPRYL